MTLKQHECETFKDNLEWFNKERLEVEGLPKNLTLAVLLNGILPQGLLMAELA